MGQSYAVSYSVTSSSGTPTGSVTVSDGSSSCTGTVAAGTCIMASTTPGTKTITVAYAGDGHFAPRTKTATHVVTNGGALAHLTSGGGWETSFAVVNLGPTSTSMSLNFFGDSGSPLACRSRFRRVRLAPANVPSVNQTLGSNAMLLLDTNPPDVPLSEGWANLTSGGDVNAYEIFHYGPSGQEAVVPMQTAVGGYYLLVYDNTSLVNTLGTGVAIANGANQPASVPFIINDDTGTLIANGSLSVPALGHTAFTLSDQYPATAGKRGTLTFTKPLQGQISVLGIRSNGNSFTTIPVTGPPAALSGNMAHIVSGGGWRTVFYLSNYLANTAGKPSTITLSFFDDAGNPLPLPLTFLQTGATLTAATITRTLAVGATLAIQAQGLDAQVALGSAQLTSDFGANAFALFRYDPSGQEATVPFETRNAGAYVLAFDNTAPLATGVAIANLSSQAANVGMILRDDAGNTLQTTTIPVPANGHYAFVLGGVYPLAAGRRGTVEFTSPAPDQRAGDSSQWECVYVDSGADKMSLPHAWIAVSAIFVATCCAQAPQTTAEDLLRQSLQRWAGDPDSDDVKTTKYIHAFVDLNGDGKTEAIVYLMGRGWCGSGGCNTLILARVGGPWKVVNNITITRPPIRVLSSTSHGWHDISVWVQGGGIQPGYDAALSFNGKAYRGTLPFLLLVA